METEISTSMEIEYRKAMIAMRALLPRATPPKVCTLCVGWEHFGGLSAEDVSNGPLCICDKTWCRVQKWIENRNKLLII